VNGLDAAGMPFSMRRSSNGGDAHRNGRRGGGRQGVACQAAGQQGGAEILFMGFLTTMRRPSPGEGRGRVGSRYAFCGTAGQALLDFHHQEHRDTDDQRDEPVAQRQPSVPNIVCINGT
jgi:hypothetical protein